MVRKDKYSASFYRKGGKPKTRNPEKVVMDGYYAPKVFKSRVTQLRAKEALQQIHDYKKGGE